MGLSTPPSISDQAIVLRDELKSYVQDLGGTAVVVSNRRQWWEQASQSSDKPRILISYDGEDSRGGFEKLGALHRVDRRWVVAVIRGRGFSANRGDSLTETRSNAEPFFDLLEKVRDKIRALQNISEEFPVDYRTMKPMQLGTLVIDGYTIEFTTANDIPGFELVT